jgi:hypothetical protein
MKIACRTLAIAALIGILATFALIQQYSYLMNNAVDVSGATQSVFLLFSPLFTILATTASALSFASGIVGIVMAGQRRQRIWFAVLLVAIVIDTCAGIVIIMIPAVIQIFYGDRAIQTLNGSVDPLLMNHVITPLLAPLAALIYSLRPQGGLQTPANARPSGEEAGLSGLEYSRLDDTRAG